MDLRIFATVFATIFIAELGDKTQLATLLYAADAENPRLTVFTASACALLLDPGNLSPSEPVFSAPRRAKGRRIDRKARGPRQPAGGQ